MRGDKWTRGIERDVEGGKIEREVREGGRSVRDE